MTNYELRHYGTLGMRWGISRAKTSSASLTLLPGGSEYAQRGAKRIDVVRGASAENGKKINKQRKLLIKYGLLGDTLNKKASQRYAASITRGENIVNSPVSKGVKK